VQKMNLLPVDDSDAGPANVTLHDLENTLAQLFASMIWTSELQIPLSCQSVTIQHKQVGHISPLHGSVVSNGNNTIILNIVNPFMLLRGNATATETIARARLDVCNIHPRFTWEPNHCRIAEHNSGISSTSFRSREPC
jgi:hypothetical protein